RNKARNRVTVGVGLRVSTEAWCAPEDSMTDERRLDDLLSRWQQERARGRTPAAAELCCDCPELAPELEKRLDLLFRMDQLAQAANNPVRARRPPSDPRGAAPPGGPPLPAVPGYEVLRELGRGGMGVVYQARDMALKHVVALKLVTGGPAPPDALARFR